MMRPFLFVAVLFLLASPAMAEDLTITVDSVQVIGTADGTGSDVKKVEVIKQGGGTSGSTLTKTATPYVFDFTSTPATPLNEGVNDLTIKAEDMANNTASIPLKITVSPSSSNPYPGDLNGDKIVNVIDLKNATSALPFDPANHTAVKNNFGKQY